MDACYLHYLQALARLDDAWGDPRRPGGRGHPFAAFLVWKLGLISYCRWDKMLPCKGEGCSELPDILRNWTCKNDFGIFLVGTEVRKVFLYSGTVVIEV